MKNHTDKYQEKFLEPNKEDGILEKLPQEVIFINTHRIDERKK